MLLERLRLMNGAEGGHADVVELLLDRGADPNAVPGTNTKGATAAMYAAVFGKLEVVMLLAIRGANNDGNPKTRVDDRPLFCRAI